MLFFLDCDGIDECPVSDQEASGELIWAGQDSIDVGYIYVGY